MPNCWAIVLDDGDLDELGEGRRDGDDRGGEDDRDDAARVDPEGQVRALAAVDLPADDPLGVGDGDAPLAALDEDDEGDDGDHQGAQEDDLQRVHGAAAEVAEEAVQAGGEADDDAGEDDEGDAVADAPGRDLLAQPHDEDRPRGQGQDGQELEPQPPWGTMRAPPGALEALQEDGDAEGLDEADADRPVAGVLGDLLPPELALLGQPLEVGPDDRQQLEDDRGADVGHDAQGEDRHPRHVPAREQVDEAEDGALLLRPEFRQGRGADARVGDLAADPVDGQEEQGEDDPLAELRDAEDVADAVEHGLTR